jgi:tRNA U54 and U55 pseudouridine synthase Pus10
MVQGKIARQKRKLELNLNTSEGTYFHLIAVIKKISEEIGLSKEREKEIIAEMISGDYEQMIQVIEREFGRYLLLFR